jgi:AcrR family transcriptional regulator
MSLGSERFQSLSASKRAGVLDAASHELARYGFHAASTNRIAAAAKISKGALFSYFPTKEELFSGVLAAQFDEILASEPTAGTEPRTGSLEGDLRALATRVETLHRRWPRLFAFGLALRTGEPVLANHDAQRARYDSFALAPLRAVLARATLPARVSRDAATALFTAVFDHLAAEAARASETSNEDRATRDALVDLALTAISK